MITAPDWLSTIKFSQVYKRSLYNQSGQCILCGCQSKRLLDLCLACENDLPSIGKACYHCAIPLIPDQNAANIVQSQTSDPNLCGQCLSKKPPQNQTIALFSYHFPVDRLITRLKFSQKTHYARVLGQLLANTVKNNYKKGDFPDAIMPVPLSRQRLRERGFNQATLLAKPVARALDIPLLKHHCERSKHTDAQSGLNAITRRRNVHNAFVLRKPLNCKRAHRLRPIRHIAIVDDVMTTGATLESLAHTLLKGKVQRVDFWVVARTPD